MPQQLAGMALLVRDYDEAIAFFTEKVGFLLLEDFGDDLEKLITKSEKSVENQNKTWLLYLILFYSITYVVFVM